jgi:D-inositol-3-phosphate glycosyltransferase
VQDGVSGVLVHGRDPGDYAAAIRRVLASRTFLAAGARRHASRFSWDRTADSLIAAYTAAAGELAVAREAARLAPARTLSPLRAFPGAQVAQ